MFSLTDISISFAGRVLYDKLNLTIGPHDRVALAGPNGAGKSTLLKIINGDVKADSGSVNAAKYTTVGYLPQEGIHHSGKTLYAEAETAFESALEVKEKLEYYERQLETLDHESEEFAEALEIYGDLQQHMQDLDLARMAVKIERVLTGLGFKKSDLQRDTGEFSGGWQMRIALGKLLLKEPSVLLLDEPTNHLDIESLTWLEAYLKDYQGAIVLVSHDRSFLDNITTKTCAFRRGRVEEYNGNYSFYLKESAARKEQLIKQKKAQEREIATAKAWIDRFRSKASKATQVQSRIKALEKIEIIEVEDEDKEISFKFPQPQPSGQWVIQLNDVVKQYGDNLVLDGIDLRIEKGDRLAVVGVNGAGKSTLVRILAGVEPINAGERKEGYKVETSYFAQNQAEELNPNHTVLEAVEEDNRAVGQTQARSLLGCFLFRGDDAFKPVKVLSGGEKNRLALSKMLLRPANFLILDEPTNHLDMQSQDVLQKALLDYTGTFVIVSHNRAFVDPIVNKVLEISQHKATLYLGNVTEYVEKKREMAEKEQKTSGQSNGTSSAGARDDRGTASATAGESVKMSTKATSSSGSGSSSSNGAAPAGEKVNRKEERRLNSQRRQEKSKKLKPLEKELEEVEEEISTIEARHKEMEKLMSDPDVAADGDRVRKMAAEYRENKARVETLYSRWSELSDEIDKIEAQFAEV